MLSLKLAQHPWEVEPPIELPEPLTHSEIQSLMMGTHVRVTFFNGVMVLPNVRTDITYELLLGTLAENEFNDEIQTYSVPASRLSTPIDELDLFAQAWGLDDISDGYDDTVRELIMIYMFKGWITDNILLESLNQKLYPGSAGINVI